jgi:WD40 repeat protein
MITSARNDTPNSTVGSRLLGGQSVDAVCRVLAGWVRVTGGVESGKRRRSNGEVEALSPSQGRSDEAAGDPDGAAVANAGRPDAFISYSREDGVFVRELDAKLQERGKDVWVDWEDIRPSADWWATIQEGIDAAKTFVAVLSPELVSSEVCREELARAVASNKRIVPVLRRDVDATTVPKELTAPNWLFCREGDDVEAFLTRLVETLEADLEWLEEHARILVRAKEWKREGRDRSFLLRGNDLHAAEGWLSRQGEHKEAATPLQAEYVVASRRAAIQTQRVVLGAVVAALAISLALAAFAFLQRSTAISNEHVARSRELAARASLALTTNPAESLALSARAVHERHTAEARDALREAVARAPIFHARPDPARASSGFPDAAFSPDGKLLATRVGKKLDVWAAGSGRRVARLADRQPVEGALAFSPDGRLLLTEDEASFNVWVPTTGRRVVTLPKGGRDSHAVFSPPGNLLVISSDAGTGIWETSTWKRVWVDPKERIGLLFDAGRGWFSPDARRLALVSRNDRALIVRDTRSWKRLAMVTSREGLAGFAYSPDGSMLVVVSDDAVSVRTRSGVIVRSLAIPSGDWASPGFSPDGRLFALFELTGALGERRVANVWRTRDWRKIASRPLSVLSPDWMLGARLRSDDSWEVVDVATDQSVKVFPAGEFVLDVSPGERHLVATGRADGAVSVWRCPDVWRPASGFASNRSKLLVQGRLTPSGLYVKEVAFGPDRSAVAIAGFLLEGLDFGHEGDTEVWRPGEKTVLRPSNTILGSPLYPQLEFSPDGRFLTAWYWSSDGPLDVWATSTWQRVASFETGAAAWSPDGGLLALWTADRVRLYDTQTWTPVRVMGGQDNPISGASFSSDGKTVVSLQLSERGGDAPSGKDSSRLRRMGIVLWSVATGRILRTIAMRPDSIEQAVFAPGGDLVLTTQSAGATSVWDARTGSEVASFTVPRQLGRLHISPDGAVVAVDLTDNRTHVRETRSGRTVGSFPGLFADFSGDGRLLLTVTQAGTVYVWEMESRDRVLEVAQPGLMEHTAFGSDGRSIVAVGSDGIVRVFPCPGCAPLQELLDEADRGIVPVAGAATP